MWASQSEPPSPDPFNSTQRSKPPAEEPEPQSAHSYAQEQRQREQEDFTAAERANNATVADQLAGAPVHPSDGWKGTVVAKQDELVQKFHPDLFDPSVPKPSRVALSMKGIIDDPLCRWIAEQLDEKKTPAPLHGGNVGWREQPEKENAAARETGAAGVAERKPGCRRLYLNDNPITGEGIEYLADALRRNETLEELYLHYTDVGDAGLKHLLTMLTENRTLRHLELGGCGIRQGGADMLKTFFTQGKSKLEHLGLLGNDDEVIDDLADIYRALQSNADAGKKQRAMAKSKAGALDSDEDDDDW